MNVNNLQLKACIHCRHFRMREGSKAQCGSISALNGLDYVLGIQGRKSPYEMRGNVKLCGPDGRYWASQPRPVMDRIAAAGMVVAFVGQQVASVPHNLNEWRRGLGARIRHAVAAKLVAPEQPKPLEVEAVEAATMREGIPIEPVVEPVPEAPMPAPKPGDLPQAEGKVAFPLERSPKAEGQLGLAVVLACIAFLAGIVVAHALSTGSSITDRTFGATPQWCYSQGQRQPCYTAARKRKATCCYRWHDGTTRCFDCSDTAA